MDKTNTGSRYGQHLHRATIDATKPMSYADLKTVQFKTSVEATVSKLEERQYADINYI